MRELLVCPSCHAELVWSEDRVDCSGCGASYEIRDGIPILRPPLAAASPHQQQQAEFFDAADAEFEIERPHGTPWLYRWLIGEKFRRSVAALPLGNGIATAVAVCGGSGMEAEFLASLGFAVVSLDVSEGAAARARERAARHGFSVLPVVADTEALPFRDRSVDLAYVHDGLHHLETPLAGAAEMARVARLAVSVNEPARAGATEAAIRVGLSVKVEEAGNPVARLDPADVVTLLERDGLRVVRCERYAMVYRHEPGRAAVLLSLPGVRELVRAAHTAFNRLLGRYGNKLTIQAVRDS